MSRRVLAFVLAVLCSAGSARANGRFPTAGSIVFDPHDPATIYARTTFGLLASYDSGATWRWICERAIGFSGTEDPIYLVTPTGALVGGTFSGVAVSRDRGCSFAFAEGEGKLLLSDLTLAPGGEIFGMSSTWTKNGNFDNRIVVSKDDARTFARVGKSLEPTLLLESIEVAPSDRRRIYVSAVRGDAAKRDGVLVVSVDAGTSWIERKIALQSGETAPFVAAVDRKNPDRVYVRTAGSADAHTRLLVTTDAGRTWTTAFESSSPLMGFVLSEDGAEVTVGAREGVFASKTDAFAFAKGASPEIQCLGKSGPTLWACSVERTGFLIGTSQNGGQSFEAKLHLDQIRGPLQCPADSGVVRHCLGEWTKVSGELGIQNSPDVRPPADAGVRPAPPPAEPEGPSGRAVFLISSALALCVYVAYQLRRRR